MDTEKRFGIKKPKAILLFWQMILTLVLFVAAVYLLIFAISNSLGGWMIATYVFVILSIMAILVYGAYGYRKGDVAYQLAAVPFLLAVFINVLLPGRETLQVALLCLLFALTFGFLLRQKDRRFTNGIAIAMVAVSLTFSIYSSVKADTGFLGELSTNWPTYVAMYLSIFIPTVTSGTLALTYNVRSTRSHSSDEN